jgi:hypothetical protein
MTAHADPTLEALRVQRDTYVASGGQAAVSYDKLRDGFAVSRGGEAMTEAKQQKAGRARFLLLPPLSAAEREAERESERKLSVVLVEMFGPKGNYSNPEIDAACAVVDAREEAYG